MPNHTTWTSSISGCSRQSQQSWKSLARALILGLWVALAGCGGDGQDALMENMAIRDALIAQGIDPEMLLAPPTPTERAAVRADWATRDLSPQDVFEEAVFNLSDGATLRVISHTVHGERHVGAIVIPAHADGSQSLPVMLNLYGFGPPFVTTIPDGDPWGFMRRFITVIPSYRGETLKFGDQQWPSEGDRYDFCNGAADDALALLHVALAIIAEADPTRIGAYGVSRGANVAMSIAARDPRIQYVVAIAGVTDYLQTTQLAHHNLIINYDKTFTRDLLAGSATAAQARHHMLSCSPLHFAEQLPFTQLHHGTADRLVPVDHTEWLIADMAHMGRAEPEFEAFLYQDVGHAFMGATDLLNRRARRFFQPLIE